MNKDSFFTTWYKTGYLNTCVNRETDTTEATTVYNNGTYTEVKAHRTILGGKRYLTSKL